MQALSTEQALLVSGGDDSGLPGECSTGTLVTAATAGGTAGALAGAISGAAAFTIPGAVAGGVLGAALGAASAAIGCAVAVYQSSDSGDEEAAGP